MAQIQSPANYVTGQQVTAANLNNHVNGAVLLPGAITDQSSIVSNTIDASDSVVIYDSSATSLRKATASDLLNSGISITTGSVNGNAGSDIVITPAAGQKVDVNSAFEANSINCVGNSTVGGDQTVTGNQTVSGTQTVTGLATFNGTSNFVGAIQVNGVTTTIGAGGLLSVVEENIPYALGTTANTLHNLFTSASYTKPSGEIWIVELDFNTYTANNANVHYRVTDSVDSISYVSSFNVYNSAGAIRPHLHRFYLNSANTHSGTFVLRFKSAQPNIAVSPTSTEAAAFPDGSKGTVNKFRIYKYKA